ncbi:MAG: UDPglucose 6-dehydrogenase [Saprospiraceae bacterium]|jgi:UDPglucose 6-dehydrogenase
MNITVVGTGYVGLVSGTCFAETGHNVLCIDIDEKKIQALQNGIIPIYEPGLKTIFDRNVNAGRLAFSTNLTKGVDHARVIFLALPTPPDEDGSADLKYILGVASNLSKLISQYTVVVDKSTVPVGTAEKVEKALSAGLSSDLFDVVSNPEFLREGAAVDDFLKPDRIVIGAKTEKAKKVMEELYKPFVRQGNPIYLMDQRSAEMTKYAANSYLATRISFMNEIANLCDLTGANVDSVRLGMGSDGRIGKRFLFPGVGYGGSCFPKDVQALAKTADDHNYDFKILKSVMNVNGKQKLKAFAKLKEIYGDSLKDKTVGIWGLSFKPNTDDIREAPALFLIEDLLSIGANVKAYDPEAMPNVQELFKDSVEFCPSFTKASSDIDVLVIMTEWAVFRNPDFEHLKHEIRDKTIFDGRNLFEPEEMKTLGFKYYSIGRPQ